MSRTELEHLNLNLEQFSKEQSSQEILIKLNDNEKECYLYTDFENNQYIIPGEKEIQEKGCQVILEFKNIGK
jgi:hypothetical protein